MDSEKLKYVIIGAIVGIIIAGLAIYFLSREATEEAEKLLEKGIVV